MTTDAAQTLYAIELSAERAIVQELRIMLQEVLALRPLLNMGDRAHADALLLKLDRLIGDQLVVPEAGFAVLANSLPLAKAIA